MNREEKAEALAALREKCLECHECGLSESRTNVVFGKGNPDADILFIGEAPGEKEDLSGEPFVGAAGKLLDSYLKFIELGLEDVYIANILKCRPPQNRDPLPGEQDKCIGFLREQLKIIEPKAIICLGRIAAMRVIKPDFKITAEHGSWFMKGGYKIMAVFHPAALLRDPRRKEDMLADFKKIEKEIKK